MVCKEAKSARCSDGRTVCLLTLPKPPSPMRHTALKPAVASASSAAVYTRTEGGGVARGCSLQRGRKAHWRVSGSGAKVSRAGALYLFALVIVEALTVQCWSGES